MSKFLTLLTCTLFMLNITPIQADEVTAVADRWYPYNGIPGDPNPGYMIEIARYGLAKGGHTLKYQLMSWGRALDLVKQGKKNCIIGASKSEGEGFIFTDIYQGVVQAVFVRRKDSSWKYTGVNSLKKIRLGAIDGYEYADDIDQHIQTQGTSGQVTLTRGKFALEQNLLALINNNLDSVITSQAVVMAAIKKNGWENEVELAGNADLLFKIYFACSPTLETSSEYTKLISDGLKELRNNGQLEKILGKYGLEDWHDLSAVDD